MKKYRLPVFVLSGVLAISTFGLTSCNTSVSNESKIKIDSTLKGGTLSLKDLVAGDDGFYTVSKGSEVTLEVETNTGFTLENVTYNGELLSSPYSFKADDSFYVLSASFLANVESEESGLSKIEVSGSRVLNINGTGQYSAEVYGPSNKIIWTTSDETIATVDQTGLVKGLKAGAVNIKAESVKDSTIVGYIPVFVMPDYVYDFVSTIADYNYTQGITYEGLISLGGILGLPATLNFKTIHQDDSLSNGYSFVLDLNFQQISSILNLVMQLANTGTIPLGFSLEDKITEFLQMIVPTWTAATVMGNNSNISLATMRIVYLGDGTTYACLKNGSGTTYNVAELSPLAAVGGIIDKVLKLINGMSSGEQPSLQSFAINAFEDVAPANPILDVITSLIEDPTILNQFLVYEEDKTKGIHLNDEMMAQLNAIYTPLRDSILASLPTEGMAAMASSMVKQILPLNFSYIGLRFASGEGTLIGSDFDGKEVSKGAYLVVEGPQEKLEDDPDAETVMIPLLTVALGSKFESLDANYFSTIKTNLEADKVTFQHLSVWEKYSKFVRDYIENNGGYINAKESKEASSLINKLWVDEYNKLMADEKTLVDYLHAFKPYLEGVDITVNDKPADLVLVNQDSQTYTLNVKKGDVIKVKKTAKLFDYKTTENIKYSYGLSGSNLAKGYKTETTDELITYTVIGELSDKPDPTVMFNTQPYFEATAQFLPTYSIKSSYTVMLPYVA